MEEGGRGGSEVREVRVVGEGVAGSLESRLFLLGRMVVWTMLRNLPTVGSMSSGERQREKNRQVFQSSLSNTCISMSLLGSSLQRTKNRLV